MSNGIGERLREERKRLGLNQASFGEIGGVKLFAQSNYENGKRVPNGDYFAAIADRGVDIAYVITGIKRDCSDELNSSFPIASLETKCIPVYDLEAAAGNGAAFEHEDVAYTFPLPISVLEENGLSANQCIMLTIRGDSMEPTLANGDLVLIDRSITKPDGIFLISMGGELRVKRVQRAAGFAYILASDNPKYREELVKPTELHTITLLGKCVLKLGPVS